MSPECDAGLSSKNQSRSRLTHISAQEAQNVLVDSTARLQTNFVGNSTRNTLSDAEFGRLQAMLGVAPDTTRQAYVQLCCSLHHLNGVCVVCSLRYIYPNEDKQIGEWDLELLVSTLAT